MIVVGSRLRGNETHNNKMPLPRPLIQIDADASQGGRNYEVDQFIHGDAADVLGRLLKMLPETLEADPSLGFDIAQARAQGEGRIRDILGPYARLADILNEKISAGAHPWVRDVTNFQFDLRQSFRAYCRAVSRGSRPWWWYRARGLPWAWGPRWPGRKRKP